MARLSTLLAGTALAIGATALPAYEQTKQNTPAYCGKIAEPTYMWSLEKYPGAKVYSKPSEHVYIAKKYGQYTGSKKDGNEEPYTPVEGEHPPEYLVEHPETTYPEQPEEYKEEHPGEMYPVDEYPEDKYLEQPEEHDGEYAEANVRRSIPGSIFKKTRRPSNIRVPKVTRRSTAATHEYAEVVAFQGPLGHYGCQLSVTFPEDYPYDAAHPVALSVYKLEWPLATKYGNELAYAGVKKVDGLYGTSIVAKPGKYVINTGACPTGQYDGAAYMFEVADWYPYEAEAEWDNAIYAEDFMKSVGIYMNYDC